MAQADLAHLLNLYVLPVGRRIHALRKTQTLVKAEPSLSGLNPLVSVAMEENTVALDRRTRWGEAKNEKTAYPELALVLNQEHDQLFASMERVATGMADGMPSESPQAKAGVLLTSTLYAEGLAALTQKDFVQQRETTTVWLGRMNADLAEPIDLLGLRPMADRLRVVNEDLGKIIDEVKSRAKVSFDEVRTADAAGQLAMLQVVADILGRFKGREPGDDAMRAKLLGPILEQNEKVGELYRRRARVTDVDPESGEVTDPPVVG